MGRGDPATRPKHKNCLKNEETKAALQPLRTATESIDAPREKSYSKSTGIGPDD